jgi:UDPglucose--hexose-1-phosphate uridylyltransferase
MDAPATPVIANGVFRNRPAQGIARVLCYSPRHDLSLAQLKICEIEELLSAWRREYVDLGKRAEIDHVLIFENKGEAVGVSNPHPHCQIYGTNFVFKVIETEAQASSEFFAETGTPLFAEIIAAEQRAGTRIISENETAIAFLPYFARYAYEVFVAPKTTHPSIASLSEQEMNDLAQVLKDTVVRFDNLWQMPFPYVMPLHQAPTDGGDYRSFHFHIEFHPPLRRPNLLKYLAGPEIGGGNFLSDTSPEEKAAELRSVSNVHYTELAPTT